MSKRSRIKNLSPNMDMLEKVDNDKQSVLFSFDLTINHKRYGFENLSSEDKLALIKKIYGHRNKTWYEVIAENRHNNGSEKIDKNSIRIDLKISPDTTLLSLRFNKLKPMLGFREGRIFYIICFDPDFTLYNHG